MYTFYNDLMTKIGNSASKVVQEERGILYNTEVKKTHLKYSKDDFEVDHRWCWYIIVMKMCLIQ